MLDDHIPLPKATSIIGIRGGLPFLGMLCSKSSDCQILFLFFRDLSTFGSCQTPLRVSSGSCQTPLRLPYALSSRQWCSSLTYMCVFSAASWMLCIVANVPLLILGCSVAGPPHRLKTRTCEKEWIIQVQAQSHAGYTVLSQHFGNP